MTIPNTPNKKSPSMYVTGVNEARKGYGNFFVTVNTTNTLLTSINQEVVTLISKNYNNECTEVCNPHRNLHDTQLS